MGNETGLYYWKDGERLVLFLSGRITANEAYTLYHHVEPWLAEHPTGTVIADMNATRYLDSTAIGTLVRLHKQRRRQGGSFALCNLSVEVESIIRKTKLLRYFRVVLDEELRDLEHDAFRQIPRRDDGSLDSCFVLDAHNDICEVVPELKPQFEKLMTILAADQESKRE
ncbi:MAG: anti-sigma factor antagonist [Spirochaetaceae bacterium]|nr:MAG: anti-sigma factor antagonist [Spirochaetaceae bacterium]